MVSATTPAGGPGQRRSSERSPTQDDVDGLSPIATKRDSFVATRMYQKSKSKNLDNLADHMKSLPKAMRKGRSKAVEYIYTVLDDPSSSDVAWWTARFLQAFVLLSVLGTFLQTVDDPPLHGLSAAIVETVVDAVFLSEICIRWFCAPNKVNFVFIFHSWIDIAAASALAVRAAVGFVLPESRDDSISIFLLCFVPTIRLLKIVRHFQTFDVLVQAVKITMEVLPMLLYAVALITMTFASLIYFVEPELFESPFRAIWFCLVTVTTVGYGDYVPVTTAGITIVMILIVLGVILMAVPIGIIGNTFNQVWQEKDYSLLLSKTRMKLKEWGYTAHDIPKLFKLVDYDESGILEQDEFVQLVKEMGIGLSEDRIIKLFAHMDKDGSQGLSASEFALALFPHNRKLKKAAEAAEAADDSGAPSLAHGG
jgi:voltage-gated potassium channel